MHCQAPCQQTADLQLIVVKGYDRCCHGNCRAHYEPSHLGMVSKGQKLMSAVRYPRDGCLDGVLEGAQVEHGLGLLLLAQLVPVGLAGRRLRPPPRRCFSCRCCRRLHTYGTDNMLSGP